jgi:hypothetical protein
VQSRTLDRHRHTHLLGSWAKNRSKQLLAAAATPNQDRTPTFVLSTRPCHPVAVINISSPATIHSSPPFFPSESIDRIHLSLILFCRTSRAGHETADHASFTTPYSRHSVDRSLDGEDQIRSTKPAGWGIADEPPRKASVNHAHLLTSPSPSPSLLANPHLLAQSCLIWPLPPPPVCPRFFRSLR